MYFYHCTTFLMNESLLKYFSRLMIVPVSTMFRFVRSSDYRTHRVHYPATYSHSLLQSANIIASRFRRVPRDRFNNQTKYFITFSDTRGLRKCYATTNTFQDCLFLCKFCYIFSQSSVPNYPIMALQMFF